jgi:WD40 repeat protein
LHAALLLAVSLALCAQSAAQSPAEFLEPAPAPPHEFNVDKQAKKNIKPLRELVGHHDRINSVQFVPPDGKQAVSCSDDGTLRLWQLEDGREVRSITGLEGQLKALVVLAGSKQVITAGSSKVLYVCNLETGTVEQSLAGPTSCIVHLGVTVDRNYVVALDDAGNAYTWKLTDASPQCTPLPKHPAATGPLFSIRFSPDGKTLWATGDFLDVCRWSVGDWTPLEKVTLQSASPNRNFAISTNGKFLLTATHHTFCTAAQIPDSDKFDTSIRVMHVSSLSNIERVLPIGSDYFALLGGDGAIEFWRAKDEQFAGQFPMPVSAVTATTFALRQHQSLTGHVNGKLYLWDVNCLRERPEDDVWTAANETRQWLQDKQFDKLTAKADEYRKTRGCFASGESTLSAFYINLNLPKDNDWAAFQALLDEWHTAKPDSIAPLVEKAEALVSEGWAARGSGWASTVTQEGWRTFHEKLNAALDVIADAEKLDEKDPELYRIQMIICMGISLPREQMDAAFKKGTDIDPFYFPLYEQAASARLPRWSGANGELADWASDTCDTLLDRGDEVYARIALSLAGYNTTDYFAEMQLDWNRIKRGLKPLLETYDDSSYIAGRAGMLALLKYDHEIAAKALPILGFHRQEVNLLGSGIQLRRWQKWAEADEAAGDEEKLIVVDPKGVSCAALSADGRYLVTEGDGYGIQFRFWDTSTWQPFRQEPTFGRDSTVMALHPSEPMIAVAGGPIAQAQAGVRAGLSFGLELCDFSKGQQDFAALLGHNDVIQALAFSPDGALLASGGKDRLVCLRKIPLEAHADTLNLPSEVMGVVFTADGKTLAVATKNDGVTLWDVPSRKQIDKLPDAAAKYVSGKALATSHNGLKFAYLNADRRVTIYDWQAKANISTLRHVGGETLVIAFSSDDKLLATAGDSAKVQLWDVATGKELHGFFGHFQPIRNLFFLPDGNKLVSVADDATLRVWDISAYAGN